MANTPLTRQERVYVAKESAYGTIPATWPGGSALPATDCIRFARLTAMNDVQSIQRPDKTGTRSATAGSRGRAVCNWSLEMGLAGPGSAAITGGTVPHVDPILQAIFGKAGTHPAAGPFVYTIDDLIPSISIADMRKRAGGYTGANASDRIIHGAIVQQAVWNLGQDAATWTVSGLAQYAIESDRLADYTDSADIPAKGGLASFPTEPASPDTTDGGLCIGFTGSWTTPDGAMGNIRQAQVVFTTGNDLIRDTFGTFYATGAIGGERAVTVSFSVYDDDSTATSKLRKYANMKEAIDITMVVGSVAGNVWTFKLNGVQLASPTLSEPNQRFSLDFGASRAFATSTAVMDDLQMELS